ncbi:hypothetical protein DL769_001415 [Monosporascus sp. CRB-8-3]|nr:hypothetical protein DL769_001415 [Monosporascus sp. CRB-8-3]
MQRPQEFIGVSYAGRGIYIKKPATWDDLLRTVSQRFQLSYATAASLRALYSSDMSGTSPHWEMDASAWAGVKPDSSIYLESNESLKEEEEGTGPSDEDSGRPAVRNDIHNPTKVVLNLEGPDINCKVRVRRTITVERFMCLIKKELDLDDLDIICLFEGNRLLPNDIFESLDVRDGDTIEVYISQTAGKPAIYLLSPTFLEAVKVSVVLRPEWDFTVLYPLAPITKSVDDSTSTVSWTVSVQPDGTLTKHSTGRQSSYLFWEARSLLSSTPRLLSAGEHDSAFDPCNPTVFFERWHANVTLPFDRFEPYLDSVLQSFTLTPAMRTEFIVYWLPSFQRIRDRGQDIRFTFVPQEAFNKAAELTVEGAVPKAVARVFMLFGGVENQELRSPDAVHQTSTEHASEIDWPGVIGLDVQGMEDESAFRVLEWGGMEWPPDYLLISAPRLARLVTLDHMATRRTMPCTAYNARGWKASCNDCVTGDPIRKFTDDSKQLTSQLKAQAALRNQLSLKPRQKASCEGSVAKSTYTTRHMV